ncbi:TerY-C metal binding domain-containing protein [Flammeovirga aprica]|uniref:VWA domain-containing protein n=1 Tax=Flammeovirga aprica JL-4 TaxID=694437 RepID=A0A7X9XAZ8_9BACT|nr:TerY-C metal binding domain-containing protein [Flammeovirga aprica]NME70123.1 VWA domain-containing protein [Flammeovirga aprica JL-4]
MRKLPIYFLLDVSESMIGSPIESVQSGLASIVKSLKSDPYALETVYLEVIVFAGKAKVLVPLEELAVYYPPVLPIGSGTSLGEGMNLLMNELDKNTVKRSSTFRGDWKPIVYIFTDGVPTDKYDKYLQKWELNYKSKINTVVVSIGNNIDSRLLERISENVFDFNTTDPKAFTSFFKWITDSIKTHSVKIDSSNDDDLDIRQINDLDDVEKIDLSKGNRPNVDQNTVTLLGKCQNTHSGYIIKYNKYKENSNAFNDFGFMVTGFSLEGAFKINLDEFRSLSQNININQHVNTAELRNFPSCPCCGNQIAVAICSCGSIFCADPENIEQTCPWCHNTSYFGRGNGDIDIERTIG